jgi:hypothetical protein
VNDNVPKTFPSKFCIKFSAEKATKIGPRENQSVPWFQTPSDRVPVDPTLDGPVAVHRGRQGRQGRQGVHFVNPHFGQKKFRTLPNAMIECKLPF